VRRPRRTITVKRLVVVAPPTKPFSEETEAVTGQVGKRGPNFRCGLSAGHIASLPCRDTGLGARAGVERRDRSGGTRRASQASPERLRKGGGGLG